MDQHGIRTRDLYGLFDLVPAETFLPARLLRASKPNAKELRDSLISSGIIQ